MEWQWFQWLSWYLSFQVFDFRFQLFYCFFCGIQLGLKLASRALSGLVANFIIMVITDSHSVGMGSQWVGESPPSRNQLLA